MKPRTIQIHHHVYVLTWWSYCTDKYCTCDNPRQRAVPRGVGQLPWHWQSLLRKLGRKSDQVESGTDVGGGFELCAISFFFSYVFAFSFWFFSRFLLSFVFVDLLDGLHSVCVNATATTNNNCIHTSTHTHCTWTHSPPESYSYSNHTHTYFTNEIHYNIHRQAWI